jgi:tRNA threonylcarbamoyladenosine biosynthesis protein TsaB
VLILAADTSSPVLSIALGDETRLMAETYVECGRAHSERMLETLAWLLDQAGIAQADVEAYAVSIGPGSFTGLRIGVAALKGLALAHQKPLIGVATLPAMARASGVREGTVCPLLDARMNEVFGAVYSYASGVRCEVVPMQAAPIQTFLEHTAEDTLFIGAGAREYAGAIHAGHPDAPFGDVALNHPRAGAILAEARDMYTAGETADPAAVAPIYLRGSQAEEARKA